MLWCHHNRRLLIILDCSLTLIIKLETAKQRLIVQNESSTLGSVRQRVASPFHENRARLTEGIRFPPWSIHEAEVSPFGQQPATNRDTVPSDVPSGIISPLRPSPRRFTSSPSPECVRLNLEVRRGCFLSSAYGSSRDSLWKACPRSRNRRIRA